MSRRIESFAEFDRLLASARSEVDAMLREEPDDGAIASVKRQLDALHGWTRGGRCPVQAEKDQLDFGQIASRALDTYPVARTLWSLASFITWWEPRAQRIVVFGNSGSGKTTYARKQAERLGCAHMDLDEVAWVIGTATPTRQPIEQSRSAILGFIAGAPSWIIEGCYADLLDVAMPHATEIVFLNPGTETCVENARRRPWEPHKYASPEAQDANLGMLIEWIRDYDRRSDEFSLLAHRRLFNGFTGPKQEFTSNARD